MRPRRGLAIALLAALGFRAQPSKPPASGDARRILWCVTAPRTAIDTDGFIRDRARRIRVRGQGCVYDLWNDRLVCDHKDTTSLHTGDGRALDPTVVRYVVVSADSGIPVGTEAVVFDPATGRSFAAVVGDVGPRIGEVSLKLARDLDRRAGPRNGIDRPLVYTFFIGARLRAANQEDLLISLAQDGPELIDAAWRDSPFDEVARLSAAPVSRSKGRRAKTF
jgi:hypothetical protein